MLLACQQCHRRLSLLEDQKAELKRELANAKRPVADAEAAVQRMKGDYASICSEETVKESEIHGVKVHQEKLDANLSNTRNNLLYRQISEEV